MIQPGRKWQTWSGCYASQNQSARITLVFHYIFKGNCLISKSNNVIIFESVLSAKINKSSPLQKTFGFFDTNKSYVHFPRFAVLIPIRLRSDPIENMKTESMFQVIKRWLDVNVLRIGDCLFYCMIKLFFARHNSPIFLREYKSALIVGYIFKTL